MQPDLQLAPATGTSGIAATQNRVLRNTYALLGVSMIPTVIGAIVGTNLSFAFMRASPIISVLVLMAIVYGLMFAIEKNKDSSVGVYLLLVFTFFMGVILGPLLQVALSFKNGAQLIAVAAGGTGITFMAMAAFSATTKRDLSGMGRFLFVGAIVLMIAVVANIFLQMPALQLALSAAFILFSSMIIAYTINSVVHGGETNYISATLSIYVSIYNIFSSLLQILMAVTGNRD